MMHLDHRRTAGAALLALLLTSCAAVPRPIPPPPRPPVIVAAPPPAPAPALPNPADWDMLPMIEGAWDFDPLRRSARFVDDAGVERASLSCAVPGVSMRISMAGDGSPAMMVFTSSATKTLSAQRGAALLDIGDTALDAIAFSRGRFALSASQLLVLPVQSEIGRVIEDCRG
jgi:hypothetical protein